MSRSAIEGLLELKREHGFRADEIDRIEIDIFEVAYNIIGGGEEGDKTKVRSKEEADHSLQYMVAVALLDGRGPEPFAVMGENAGSIEPIARLATVINPGVSVWRSASGTR